MTLLKPIGITSIYLSFLYVLAVLLGGSVDFFTSELMRIGALTLTFVLPVFAVLKYKKQKIHWGNIVITLLILLLLADINASIELIFGLGLVTFFFKIFVRVQKHPVFNPAVIGLTIMYFFGLLTTWWGVSFSPRFTQLGISSAMLITLPLGLYIVWKYKKMPTLISTLVGLVLGSLLLQGVFPLVILLEGTFAFFLFIMATEPKTTPVIDKQEWVYGALLGLSFPVWTYFKIPLPYLLNLLILNAMFTTFKLVKTKKLVSKAVTS